MSLDDDYIINQLRMTLGKMEVALGGLNTSIIWVNKQGIIQWCNNAFTALVNKPKISLLEKALNDELPLNPIDQKKQSTIHPLCECLAQEKDIRGSFEFNRDNETIVLDVRCKYIHATKETDVIVIILMDDISQQNKLDKIKNELIATVSHELKTPLTSIIGAVSLLLNPAALNSLSAEDQKKFLELADKNARRLMRYINTLLNIERLESEQTLLEKEPVLIQDILENSIQQNEPYAIPHQVSFKITQAEPHVRVLADADRLLEVFDNLLSNAIKFSPEGENITVSLNLNEDKVRLSVKNLGPGIPKKYQPHVFEKFSRAYFNQKKRGSGSGLGMYICKQIVKLHQGNIWFESTPKKGTTFFVELPVYRDDDHH